MAGVLLVEKYANKQGRVDYAVILFYNINKELYEDTGGGLMDGKTIQESASTELIEESCNLFRIHPSLLRDYTVYRNFYSFLLYVRGPATIHGNNPIYSKYYHHNKNIIHNNDRVPHMFKETDNMRRFYISDLINCGLFFNRDNLVCSDANGHVRKISKRTVGIIQSFFYNGLIYINGGYVFINSQPLTLHINYGYDSLETPFLNNTICYF